MQTGNARRRRAQALKRQIELGKRDQKRNGESTTLLESNAAVVEFREGLRDGGYNPRDYGVRSLFEALVPDGREIVDSWDPEDQGTGVMLTEAAIDSSSFTAISGQIVYQTVLENYNQPEFIGGLLCPDRQTQFDGEKIAGISTLGDVAEVVPENEAYPTVGLSSEYIETPRTKKRGMIVPVTKEAIFFDRTGILLQNAGEVGASLGINKEKRCLDAALGIDSLYKRNGRAAVATYGDDSGDHDFDNLEASNQLVDWTDVEAALLLFDGMTDPNSAEPINVLGNLVIVVPTALRMTAMSILNATEVREVTNTNTTTISANPLHGQFAGQTLGITLVTSPYVKNRTSSDTTWFIGNPSKAFAYGVNWPITSVVAPTNNSDEFHRDIVTQYKVSERGAAEVHDPRYMVKSTT